MNVKYKLIEKAQPGVAGGGTKKWYAQIINDNELTTDGLAKSIEKFSALSEPDIKGVIIALENLLQEAFAEGRIVKLDKLGTFYPTLSSEGVANKDEFNADSHIKGMKINFRPGTRITTSMKSATFKRK